MLTLGGCATSHLVSDLPNDPDTAAATLYIQRPPGGLGALGGMHIAVDGKPLGTIGVGQYWKLSLQPGMHNVSINTGSVGVAMQPRSVHCVVVGVWLGGTYIHPAENCPPPPSWKLAAESQSFH